MAKPKIQNDMTKVQERVILDSYTEYERKIMSLYDEMIASLAKEMHLEPTKIEAVWMAQTVNLA